MIFPTRPEQRRARERQVTCARPTAYLRHTHAKSRWKVFSKIWLKVNAKYYSTYAKQVTGMHVRKCISGEKSDIVLSNHNYGGRQIKAKWNNEEFGYFNTITKIANSILCSLFMFRFVF